MTNRLFLIAGLVGVSGAAFAQNFTESFDTGPTGWGDPDVSFGNTAGGDPLAFSSGTWHALNVSTPQGPSGWFSAPNPPEFPTHSGAGMANANFNNTSGTGTINNFLMTPVRLLANGDTLQFWTRTVTGPEFPDRLIVKMSTNGSSTAAGDFGVTLLTINPNLTVTDYPSVWTQFTATVSGLGAPTSGRLAFNYNVTNAGPTGDNADFIGVDDVVYTSVVPEPATMAVLGLGAAALLRRRRRN